MSDQTPWGKQKKQEPDDIFKNLFEKLKKNMGNQPPSEGGNGSPGRPSAPNARPVIAGIIGVILLFVIYNSVYQIQPGEKGVVTFLGKYSRSSGPGLNFVIPFIEKIQIVNVEIIRKEEFGTGRSSISSSDGVYANEVSLMLTGDKNVINLNWVVQYRITSPENYLFNVVDPRGTVRDISETVIRRHVGNRDFDYVLDNREELAFVTREEMQIFLDKYKSGISIDTVQLLDVNPPEKVRPSFNEVNEADQDKTRLVNEAQRQYNERIPKARGQAKQVIEEAEGYKIRRLNTAQGEVSRFNDLLTEYNRYKSVTRSRLYLETMRQILPNVNEVLIVDGDKNVIPLLNFGPTGKSSVNLNPLTDSKASNP